MSGGSVAQIEGAEPFEFLQESEKDRATGVLLCHGFSGSPKSMRPWGDYLAAQGYSVSCPLLPGHGTTWQKMNRTRWHQWYAAVERSLHTLADHCDRVVIAGLSMGGTLAIRLTEQYAGAGSVDTPGALGDRLIGTILVNPSLGTERKDAFLLPYARHIIGSFPGIANDIAKPGVDEGAYTRLPLQAAYSLQQLWALCRKDLKSITTPVLLFRSAQDHVVEAVSSSILLEGISSEDVTQTVLQRSYHVATLDYDADYIFERSRSWIGAHT